MAAVCSVEPVVGTHHRACTGIDAALEMREINLSERALVHADVDVKARILHAVGGEVLGGRHHVVPLNAACQRRPHFAQQKGILPIGFLGSAPCGVTQEVDAHTAKEIATVGAQLPSNGLADATLEFHIETRAPGHGNGKAGGTALGDAARSVVKEQVRNPESRVTRADGIEDFAIAPLTVAPMREEAMAREHVDLLVKAELFDPRVDLGRLFGRCGAFLNHHACTRQFPFAIRPGEPDPGLAVLSPLATPRG